MNAVVIMLTLSIVAFGQECQKKDLAAGGEGEWKLRCKGDGCTGKIVFQNEEELKKNFAKLIANKVERIRPDETNYLDTATKEKTAPTPDTTGHTSVEIVDSSTMPGSSDTPEAPPSEKVSTQPSTTPPPSTETACPTSVNESDVTATSNKSCFQSSFTFANSNQTSDYVRYNGTLPHLTSFSICAWLSPAPPHNAVKGSLFSYCKGESRNCKSLNVMFPSSTVLRTITHITTGGFSKVTWNIEPIRSRSHFCVTASTEKNFVSLFINGDSVDLSKNLTNGWKVDIPSGGILIIGQEQDLPQNRQTRPYISGAHQAFVGKIEDLNLWDRILNETEIRRMNRFSCSYLDDAIVILNRTNVEVEGNVAASFGNGTCDKK